MFRFLVTTIDIQDFQQVFWFDFVLFKLHWNAKSVFNITTLQNLEFGNQGSHP